MSSKSRWRRDGAPMWRMTAGVWGLAILTLMTATPTVYGQAFVDEKDALEGLHGVYVLGGDLDQVLTSTGLRKDDVLAVVSARLGGSRIPILDETEWLMRDDSPVLHIDLNSSVSDEGLVLYGVRLEILFLVNPVSRRNFTTYAVAWGKGKYGVLGPNGSITVLHEVELLVDHLIADFDEVNG